MPAGGWKLVSLVSAVQVLSEAAFFAQGILACEENNESSGRKELDWIRICVPLFYAATRQISEPCWRWILKGCGDRMTVALGAATITVSIVAASCQNVFLGKAAYILLGGVGMGLVRLQLKLMKFHLEEDKAPVLGAGISGISLSLWPPLACLFVRSLGPRYATLIFAGITLHAVPLAIFTRPVVETQSQDVEDGDMVRSTVISRPTLPDVPLSSQLQEYRLPFQFINDYDSYRIRPSYYAEVLPGIPEEIEQESDHERDHEMQRTVPERTETVAIYKGKNTDRKSISQKTEQKNRTVQKQKTKIVALKDQVFETKPFAYTIFIATILLRVGDQFGVTIFITFLPIFAGYLMPDLRLQERAFLVSLCGFSKILAEFPLLSLCMRSKKTKLVSIAGPLSAAVGFYLTWNSASLDAMTLASFGLGIGTGAASAAIQLLPKESPVVSDVADIIVGSVLLAIVPLARILIIEHAVHGCLLLAAGIYATAGITSVFSLRRGA